MQNGQFIPVSLGGSLWLIIASPSWGFHLWVVLLLRLFVMNWLKKLPSTRRANSGLEWVLWRKLPLIAFLGALLPLLLMALAHWLADPQASAADARWLQQVDYMVLGVLLFHASMLVVAAFGCVIVMVMKGPAYVADGYPVSHSDQPRHSSETDEEAAQYRAPDA